MYQADNGDGTFSNPLLMEDYPDCDIIRVDDSFLMVSSSFNRIPGMPILQSPDLVNWTLLGYVFNHLSLGPSWDLDGGDVYGKGLWAPFIRFNPHDRLYYVGATSNDPDEGFVLFTSPSPEGPYTVHRLGGRIYDPTLLIEDDGTMRLYFGHDEIRTAVLHTSPYRVGESRVVHRNEYRNGLEGCHAYRIGDQYFLSMTLGGREGSQVVGRSDSPYGPFEVRMVHDSGAELADSYSHQGGLVETPEGEWWWFLFQDRDHIGRCPVLQPLTWVDGWPLAGDPFDGFRSVPTWTKPLVSKSPAPKRSWVDDFDTATLRPEWQWNHNPVEHRWSVGDRPGFLRLQAGAADGVTTARNTLMRKIVGPSCSGTCRLDASALADGDVAGLLLSNFAPPDLLIGVTRDKDGFTLVARRDGRDLAVVPLDSPVVDLRIHVSKHGTAFAEYRCAGNPWTPVDGTIDLRFSIRSYVGHAFGLVCYSTREVTGGHADFDWFALESDRGAANNYTLGEEIDAARFDRRHDTKLLNSSRGHVGSDVLLERAGSWIGFDNIDFLAGARWVEVRVLADGPTGELELRLGGPTGEVLATLDLAPEYGVTGWRTIAADVIRTPVSRQRLCLRTSRATKCRVAWIRIH